MFAGRASNPLGFTYGGKATNKEARRKDVERVGEKVDRDLHELWTLANCGWYGIGNDATYNPTTCFETFPFSQPSDEQRTAIAEAAAELDRLRSNWLNPPEWVREEVLEFPNCVEGPWGRYVHDANAKGIELVRFSERP
jgi:hypothetical protein